MFFYHQLKNGESIAISNVEEITMLHHRKCGKND